MFRCQLIISKLTINKCTSKIEQLTVVVILSKLHKREHLKNVYQVDTVPWSSHCKASLENTQLLCLEAVVNKCAKKC